MTADVAANNDSGRRGDKQQITKRASAKRKGRDRMKKGAKGEGVNREKGKDGPGLQRKQSEKARRRRRERSKFYIFMRVICC